MSIVSLLDILTILLCFLLRSVSTDAQRMTVPANMSLPTTITNQELIENGLTVVIRVYPDRVLVGTDNLPAGKPEQLVDESNTREIIFNYMKHEAAQINRMNTKSKTSYQPCLLIQADKQIPCLYITQLIKIAAGASFANIYFSTLQDQNWLQKSAQQIQ
jgi:biopolymer transport protein ExbD